MFLYLLGLVAACWAFYYVIKVISTLLSIVQYCCAVFNHNQSVTRFYNAEERKNLK